MGEAATCSTLKPVVGPSWLVKGPPVWGAGKVWSECALRKALNGQGIGRAGESCTWMAWFYLWGAESLPAASVPTKGTAMKLYKFLKPDRFLEYWETSLLGKTWFASWSQFNDPMEGWFSYVPNRGSQQQQAWDITQGKGQYTVCCFSRRSDHMLMWSHYTDEHRGVCLEFNIDESLLNGQRILARRVVYPSRLPALAARGTPQEQAIRFLTRKLYFWRYEAEFRLLAPDSDPGLHQVGELMKVIFGKRFSFGSANVGRTSAQQGTIISQLRSSGVEICAANIDGQTYSVTHEPTRKYG